VKQVRYRVQHVQHTLGYPQTVPCQGPYKGSLGMYTDYLTMAEANAVAKQNADSKVEIVRITIEVIS
jgi:hypothetical protein